MTHRCPKTDCTRQVRDDQLACRPHWFQVSAPTRARVWATWRSGQTEEHREAMADAIEEMNYR